MTGEKRKRCGVRCLQRIHTDPNELQARPPQAQLRRRARPQFTHGTRTPAPTRGKAERYLVCVSVVVVVTGAGVVVCCVVVVVLCVGSEAQPEINASTATVRQETISFFIGKAQVSGWSKAMG